MEVVVLNPKGVNVNTHPRLAVLSVLIFLLVGCEPLHRDLEPVWDVDAGEATDTGADADLIEDTGECVAGGECGFCGELICTAAGEQVCEGQVSLVDDPQNCGSCGNQCEAGVDCVGGECEGEVVVCEAGLSCGNCGLGEVTCNDDDLVVCIDEPDLQTDHDNCGICGNICSGASICEAGQCTLLVNSELSGVACPGYLELGWTAMGGVDRYEVQWAISSAGPWTGGGIAAVQGESGIDVEENLRVSLHFLEEVENFHFRVAGYSGAQLIARSNRLEISVPQEDVGSVTDTDDDLIVPAGSIFSTSGTIEKAASVQIEGTLCVEPESTGGVHLIAPRVAVEPGGAISATGIGHGGGDYNCAGGQPGDAGGGGAAYGGLGSSVCDDGGGVYGSTTDRTIEMGSGGGGVAGGSGPGGGGEACGSRSMFGGAGGGFIQLESTTEMSVGGYLLANGSGAHGICPQEGGAGSGGGILLEGVGIAIEDSAWILASGGGLGQAGGGGRVKIFDLPSVNGNAWIEAAGGGDDAQDGTVFIDE